MKISELAIGVALLGALSAGTAWSQELRQPASMKQVAFEYDNYLYCVRFTINHYQGVYS